MKMNILCTLFGVWCAVSHAPPQYQDTARIVLPIEAFGANWKVKNFRKKVLFPDNFDNAVARAIYAANSYGETTKLPVTVTFAPRWYRPRHPITVTGGNLTLIGGTDDGIK